MNRRVLVALMVASALTLSGCAAAVSGREGGPPPGITLPEKPDPSQVPGEGGPSDSHGEGGPSDPHGEAGAAADPPPESTPLPPWATPVTDENFADLVAKHRPNELGRVLILEYHHFGEEEDRWTRTWENFRKDLETLYARGFRAVNLGDYLKGEMKLPAGTSPVIFTFDDSPLSQFRMVQKDGKWEPHPESVPAIMLGFAREHPDFGVAGTFFVDFTSVPFDEEENWKEKLQFLVANGFEVGNHSYTHENLALLDDEGVRRALAMQVKRVREALPDYDGWTIALPFGEAPRNEAVLREGEWDGIRYRHRAVLLVADSPVPSPYDIRQDVFALQRTQAIQSEFDRWLPFLERHRYISDGDPETIVIPESLQAYLDPAKIQGKKVRTYPDSAE